MAIDDKTRIGHMLEEAADAVSFCEDSTLELFRKDKKLSHATVRCIEIIGEAASKLTSSFCLKYPEIQWRDVVAMRNILVHAYFEIDHEIVWNTVKKDLPPLINELEDILKREG